ncbi:hypothetical protein, partial [Corallococcus sp. 4LFB]|uniref:hypothetical protein n=1 Tax=Corallococcus sp. 4LFB TaxID=3383249 RepID=UPI003976C81E
MSPHPILLPAVEQELADVAAGRGAAVAAAQRVRARRPLPGAPWRRCYTRGLEPGWSALTPARGAPGCPLPTYPWQRERFWLEPAS